MTKTYLSTIAFKDINLDDDEICEELAKPLMQLAQYAKFRLAAKDAREHGEMEIAQSFERDCDRIYSQMDERFKSW